MVKFIRISSFWLLVLLVLYTFGTEHGRSLVRFDAYPVYMPIDRILMIIALLMFSFFCVHVISGGLLGILTPLNSFLILYLLLVFPGVLFTPEMSDLGTYTFYAFWGATMLFLLSLIICSTFLGNMKPSPKFLNVYKKSSIEYLAFSCCFLVCVLFLIVSGRISSLVFFKIGDFVLNNEIDNEISQLRQVGRVDGYWLAIGNYMMTMFIPLSSAFVLVNGLIGKKRIQVFLGGIMASMSLLFLLSSGGRLAALFISFFYFVSFSMVKRVRFSLVASIGSIACWLLIFQTIVLGRIAGAASDASKFETIIISFNRALERVLLVKGYMTQRVVGHIPFDIDYLMGSSYLQAIIGQGSSEPSLAQKMFNLIFGGYNGTAGPQAFGEAYANYGLTGMLVCSVLTGILVSLSTKFVIKYIHFDAFNIVFLAYFTVLIARVGYGEFFTFKNNGIHVLLIFFLAMIFLRKLKFTKPHRSYVESHSLSNRKLML